MRPSEERNDAVDLSLQWYPERNDARSVALITLLKRAAIVEKRNRFGTKKSLKTGSVESNYILAASLSDGEYKLPCKLTFNLNKFNILI